MGHARDPPLSNYTYYWDHPFLGWVTIAAWAGLTDGFARDARSVMVGRELMWIACLVSGVLLYVLARRIDIQRPFAALAVVLFGASPLDIWYHRMVSLDNLATVWALAALVLAASRWRSWRRLGGGACFAIAFWNKETILLLFPAILWVLYQHHRAVHPVANNQQLLRGRVQRSYRVLPRWLAILKGELLPGTGTRQPGRRAGRLPAGDPARHRQRAQQAAAAPSCISSTVLGHARPLASWPAAQLSPFCTGLVIRRLRPFALGLLLQLAVMVKGGYVPYAFVTAMLPFAALLIAGTADSWRPTLGAQRCLRDQSHHTA